MSKIHVCPEGAKVPAVLPSLEPALRLLVAPPPPRFRSPPDLRIPGLDGEGAPESVLRAMARQALRALRKRLQGAAREELWMVSFDAETRLSGTHRLAQEGDGRVE